MRIYWEIVDLREEIAQFEQQYRPFPPRSGSVSKPIPRFDGVIDQQEEYERWHVQRLMILGED